MVQIFVLIVLGLRVISAEDFDPSKFDYCSVKCKINKTLTVNHTACGCDELVGKRTMLLDEMVEFRTKMLHEHNKYRNKIARGEEEKENNFPKAANMHVLNYDLELEFTAYCYLKRMWAHHDKCRGHHDDAMNAGQNIYGRSDVMTGKMDNFTKWAALGWYHEILNVTDTSIVDKFSIGPEVINIPNAVIAHFTEMIWASVRWVGCSKVHIDEENLVMKAYRSVIICNYMGPKKEGGSGNMLGARIYKRGDPCTQCPNNEKCNNQYAGGEWDALCGETLPVPTAKPFVKADTKHGGKDNGKDNGSDNGSDNGKTTKRPNGSDNGKTTKRPNGAHYTSGNQCIVLWMVIVVFFFAHIFLNFR